MKMTPGRLPKLRRRAILVQPGAARSGCRPRCRRAALEERSSSDLLAFLNSSRRDASAECAPMKRFFRREAQLLQMRAQKCGPSFQTRARPRFYYAIANTSSRPLQRPTSCGNVPSVRVGRSAPGPHLRNALDPPPPYYYITVLSSALCHRDVSPLNHIISALATQSPHDTPKPTLDLDGRRELVIVGLVRQRRE